MDNPLPSSAARITAGLTRKLDVSFVAQGKGNTGVPPDPCSISLHEKLPPGLSTRATSRQSRFVRDVHGNGVRPDVIKGAILERQGERIRLSDLDPVPEPAACSQNSCRFDEVGRQINRRHPTTAFGCEIARRAAEPATNFEYVNAGLQSCTFRVLARGHDAPAVQLVERPQIAMAGPLGIHPSSTECIINPLHYRPISVITLNRRLDVGHFSALAFHRGLFVDPDVFHTKIVDDAVDHHRPTLALGW